MMYAIHEPLLPAHNLLASSRVLMQHHTHTFPLFSFRPDITHIPFLKHIDHCYHSLYPVLETLFLLVFQFFAPRNLNLIYQEVDAVCYINIYRLEEPQRGDKLRVKYYSNSISKSQEVYFLKMGNIFFGFVQFRSSLFSDCSSLIKSLYLKFSFCI